MKPQHGADPFDMQFDADDEFAPQPDEAWRTAANLTSGRSPDPFADFPPAQEFDAGRARDADWGDIPSAASLRDLDGDPLADDLHQPPRYEPISNPVHDMIADAEAAFGEATLPRITIHVFCALPETADLAERAAADRRMERAAVVVRMGGLAAACEIYQNQPTPSLVMVESIDPAPQLIAQLDKLAEVCDPGTKVVVVGAANDIALYRELMRRGVSEYLVPPLTPLAMVRTVTCDTPSAPKARSCPASSLPSRASASEASSASANQPSPAAVSTAPQTSGTASRKRLSNVSTDTLAGKRTCQSMPSRISVPAICLPSPRREMLRSVRPAGGEITRHINPASRVTAFTDGNHHRSPSPCPPRPPAALPRSPH
ncbi:MAG TPA: hypothetical protein PLG07_07925 [Phenylobacterium sp.]|nr:hypothetical protein [Phenylobacterium sp.]